MSEEPYLPQRSTNRRPPSEAAAIEIHHGAFETPDGQRLNLVAPTRDQIVRTAAQLDHLAGQFKPSTPDQGTNDEYLWEAVEDATQHIELLVHGHDAFDIMTMLRQYLLPPDLALWSEGNSSAADAWAGAEVVALVLLGIGLPFRAPDVAGRTASLIPELNSTGAAIVELSSVQAVIRHGRGRTGDSARDDVNAMAFQLSTHETSVRGRQYESAAERINDTVLGTSQTAAAFHSALGFTYDDVIATRQALLQTVGKSWARARDHLAEGVEQRKTPDEEGLAALRALFETPSELQEVTASQVSRSGGPAVDVTEKVLDCFSAQPDGRSAIELVQNFVLAKNPLAGVAVLHRPAAETYLPLPGALSPDEIRRRCETFIKRGPQWTKYGRARDQAVEGLVADILSGLFTDHVAQYRNLRYRDAKDGHDLASTSKVHSTAPVTEADCLLVVDGVALCIEVKAGDLRPRTRQGGVDQLESDLEKTVGHAARQGDRLRSLIERHRGAWLESGVWLDLEHVQEVHSVVVCLDDLGPLALSTAEMVRSGVLPQAKLPWVVSVHDLLVVIDVLHPAQFLTYMRRRTSREAALWITGSDELDILMWFVAGGFYFHPDPDRIHANHPGSKPPTARMRREYRDQGRTLVGTFTDPLDAYYYWTEGTSSQLADCPRRKELPSPLSQILDVMREQGSPGWLRAAADFDGYDPSTQEKLCANIFEVLAQHRRDGGFHTLATGGLDDSGRWVSIFAVAESIHAGREHLEQYLLAKKHNERADRLLGVLMSPGGGVLMTRWLSYPPSDDPKLDALARAMRLVPPDRAPRVLPAKTKPARSTKRKKKSRRGRPK